MPASATDDLALRDFDTALRLDPKLADAYSRRAQVKRRLGDETGADADSAKAKVEVRARSIRSNRIVL